MSIFSDELKSHLEVANSILSIDEYVMKVANIIIDTLKNGNKIIICGNGGSAADAQHFAAELTGRYKSERASLGAIALTTDTSALTAIGNDYGYDMVFSRQLGGVGRAGDLLVAISTSGNSKNVLNATQVARENGIKSVGLSGKGGGAMNDMCDINIVVPSDDTARIQEMHILIIHTICQAVDCAFS
ncbi:D-sedoheptulose 7-phosphate isomerase [Campylobacter porcelli]|uniref:Phosphoheptose isomerase n=1 Tax=Campylobacter porcelli TaxID=1660073 RepID=A0ABU7M5J2_9BACT|nr:D-sedoheptulose 7-phosphate isomerase [Campylobacter sp. CX2-4855-23]MEE3776725.1 D-sedoheptulose 7-phosphate isomerase [Campylobacter sp. CX2-4080-23]